jgi:hypothetical protein
MVNEWPISRYLNEEDAEAKAALSGGIRRND